MSNTTLLVIVVAAVVVLAALIAAFVVFRRRSRQLETAREEYGPEFERLAEERGSEREAERELRERREKVEDQVEPLSEESRRRYDREWQRVEQIFLEDPAASLDGADQVVEQILIERNFPVNSRQEASEGLGVMHSGVIEDFREAQRIHRETTDFEGGGADLEEMREAIQKYRSVYERLTEG